MSDDKSIKKIIDGVLGKKGRLAKGYQQYTVENVWREIFGAVISKYTSSVRYKDGVLTVRITSAPLKQEIMATKDSVIERMNNNLKYKKISKLVVH